MVLSQEEELEFQVLLEFENQERVRTSLIDFMEYTGRGEWRRAKHLEILCEKVEDVERGKIKRLMVFMPPRHGKSEVISKKFPAWFLGRNPNKDILLVSYSGDLAHEFSRVARNTLREYGYLWGMKLAEDSQAVGRWGLTGKAGGMTACGAGGPITGRGAHVAVIDDPFKNWEEAQSKTIREKIWNWYRSTLRTRLAPNGAIILIMTRWHEEDLAGRLMQEARSDGEYWEVLKFPALLDREWLWPERFPMQQYEETKTSLGSHMWQSLYQQSPSPPEGGIFKRWWWKYWCYPGQALLPVMVKGADGELINIAAESLPDGQWDQLAQSWDMSFKDATMSSYVAGEVWGKRGARYYLLDQVRDRMDFVRTIQAVGALSDKWPKALTKWIEDTANGPAVISALKQKISGLIAVRPKGSKAARAIAVSPLAEAGNVYLPHPAIAPWVDDFIEELSTFPNAANSDQVDTTSQALSQMNKKQLDFVSQEIFDQSALKQKSKWGVSQKSYA